MDRKQTTFLIALIVAGSLAACDIIAGLNGIEANPQNKSSSVTATTTGQSVTASATTGGGMAGMGGATSTAAGMGGSGGAGGMAECQKPEDCKPQPTTKCLLATCEMGKCGTKPAKPNTDCNDGGGTLCDALGKCVNGGCLDKDKNNKETDVNCGGPDCSPCANDKGCNKGSDCLSGFCDLSKNPMNGSSGTCSPCTTDPQCGGTKFCKQSKCLDKVDVGGACDKPEMCKLGFCVDGYCCNNACTEKCKWCSKPGMEGACTLAPINIDVKQACDPYTCDGASADCPTKCTLSQCGPTHYCNAQKDCVVKKDPGQMCGDKAECKTGYCTDSTCCTAANCAMGMSCNNPQGMCQ
jgi:hypothetical protein